MKKIWLIKSKDSSQDIYYDTLSKLGVHVIHIPSLVFEFTNCNALKDSLKNVDQYSGIVFTSQRAVEACSDLVQNLPINVYNIWREKKIFAIGFSTKICVEEKMKFKPIGEEAANGEQLAEIILKETVPFDKPLLFPCGNLKKDIIPIILAKNDRDFRAITCYVTKEHPDLRSTLSKLFDKPDFVVFFSPSGVNFVVPILKDICFDWKGVKVIALGSSTNASLVQNNIPVCGICSEPTPDSLANLIKSRL